jgi:predicted O-linked N-acetylglucosamine transferase (SPINDLY family)
MATLTQALSIAYQHLHANRHDLAEEIVRRILAIQPDHAESWHLLGEIAHWARRQALAAEYFGRAAALDPTNADYQNDVAVVLLEEGKLDEAITVYHHALELKPDHAHVHINLGNALCARGRLDEAIVCYRRAIALRPDMVLAYNNLGGALQNRGRPDEAIPYYRRAIELCPEYAEAYSNLAPALHAVGRGDEAVACCQRAAELKPRDANAYMNLANSLQDRGQIHEAIASFRQALELQPDNSQVHSNLIFAMLLCPDLDASDVFEEQCRWNQMHAEPLARLGLPHDNDRSPERRLRVGYVSADFCRRNPAGRFVLSLLEAHDHAACEIYGYSSTPVPDDLTDRCRAAADVWRDMRGVSDAGLADVVRGDRIDVLVDLAMHTAGNRLLAFARRPAPVQATYLAYCGGTGLRAMDYRLTDPYLDPPDADERFYSERPVRLPETYWCYRPAIDAPPPNALPAFATGQVTLGSLNNSSKLSAAALVAWAGVLKAVPHARLLLHTRAGFQRDRVREALGRQGVAAERVEFVDRLPPLDYFRVYQRIDVALDPFPYGGGTTTCDALWMGVPVVSLAGRTAVGRGGLSILSNVGLPDLVAHDANQYIRIVEDLAADLPRLAALRAALRPRMQDSPLMDAPRFARNVEAAYRSMWRRWCAEPSVA